MVPAKYIDNVSNSSLTSLLLRSSLPDYRQPCFFRNYTKLAMLAFFVLLRSEQQKKNSTLPLVGIEPAILGLWDLL